MRSMAYCTLPPVAISARMFRAVSVRPISCMVANCVANRVSGGSVCAAAALVVVPALVLVLLPLPLPALAEAPTPPSPAKPPPPPSIAASADMSKGAPAAAGAGAGAAAAAVPPPAAAVPPPLQEREGGGRMANHTGVRQGNMKMGRLCHVRCSRASKHSTSHLHGLSHHVGVGEHGAQMWVCRQHRRQLWVGGHHVVHERRVAHHGRHHLLHHRVLHHA